MSVSFRFADRHDAERVRRFLDEAWARNHVYVRDPHLFEWTFGSRELWDVSDYSIALVEADGAIVGMLGGIPFVFNCHGNQSRAMWLVNYIVRPEYRRGTVALQLLNQFRSAPYLTQVAFGNSPDVVPLYRGLGARIPPPIPRNLAVLPGATGRVAELLGAVNPEWTPARAAQLATAFEIRPTTHTGAVRVEAIPDEWDATDWARIAARTVGAARTSSYLTWRYVKHPTFPYRIIGAAEGGRTGLLIWRLETVHRVSADGMEPLDRVGRIVEFLPVSAGNARELLTRLWCELADAGACAVDYYGFHGESRKWMAECGMRDLASHPDGGAMPSRFQPLDRRGGDILSAVFVDPAVPACSADPDCCWYWTKADSDQDRPN